MWCVDNTTPELLNPIRGKTTHNMYYIVQNPTNLKAWPSPCVFLQKVWPWGGQLHTASYTYESLHKYHMHYVTGRNSLKHEQLSVVTPTPTSIRTAHPHTTEGETTSLQWLIDYSEQHCNQRYDVYTYTSICERVCPWIITISAL